MNRQNEIQELNYRAAAVNLSGAATLNRETRSLEFVISTETPVKMWDYEAGDYVDEVLLAKSAVMPKQVPLLDTHDRYSVKTVLGSVRNKKTELGLVSGTAIFSSVAAAEEALTKYEEGHLTDFSAGYRVNNVTRVKKGEKIDLDGRTWKGPVNIVTSWTIKEVSCCPIGADPKAKARADHETQPTNQNHEGAIDMNKEEIQEILAENNRAMQESVISAIAAAVQPLVATKSTDDSIEQMRKDAITSKEIVQRKEKERIQGIDAAAAKLEAAGYSVDHIRTDYIESGKPADDALRAMMDVVYNTKATDPITGIRIAVGKEDKEKSRDQAVEGIMLRAGIGLASITDKQNEYQTMSIIELGKARMQVFGHSVRGLTKEQIIERALSTSDFDNILSNVANKALLDGFDSAAESYETWVDTSGRVDDFKTLEMSRASEAPSFQAVNSDGGEYKYGSMSDAKESVAVADYGVIVPFTRKAMINDDLGALSDIKEKLGVAAKRKYGDLIYAVLTGNPTMGDGNLLFDASNHSNYITSGAAPSVATLNVGAAAMATQTDLDGLQNLNIIPQFVVAPWALKGTIDALLHNTNPVVVGANTMNPWAYLTAVYDARLDAAVAAGWYMAARKGMTIKLFTLGGNMTPMLESKAGWATDGMEFKARVTAAAKAMDYRGLFYNDGA